MSEPSVTAGALASPLMGALSLVVLPGLLGAWVWTAWRLGRARWHGVRRPEQQEGGTP